MFEALLHLLSRSGLHNLWRFHVAHLPRIFHPVPFVFGALGFYLFAYVGQLHEIYLALIENDDRLRFLLGLALIAFLSAANFYCYLTLTTRRAAIIYGSMNDVELPPAMLWLRFIAAWLVGLLPLIGVAIGVWEVQDLLAKTIHSAWEATRAVPSGGPLAIPGLEQPEIIAVSWWVLVVAFVAVIILATVLVLLFCERQAGFWSYARSDWAVVFAHVFGIAMSIALVIASLALLPPIVPADPSAEILLTQLIRIGQFYLAGALLGLVLVAVAISALRNDALARRLVKAACFAIAFGALFVLPVLSPPLYLRFTQFAGPLAMIAAQCLTVFTVFILLYIVAQRVGVSLLFLLAVAVIARVWFSTDDAAPDAAVAARTTAKNEVAPQADGTRAQFAEWLTQRADLQRQFSGNFPVFVVAVQGGGIYAASAAATFLARLQDVCPAFARHVFAISGVSGGAVGAALFNATLAGPPTPVDFAHPHRADCAKLMGSGAQNPDARRQDSPAPGEPERIAQSEALRWVLTRDHLSPVLGMLTSEYADKLGMNFVSGVHYLLAGRSFVERPVWDAIDVGGADARYFERRLTRAKALEASLSCAVAARPRLSSDALVKAGVKRRDALRDIQRCTPIIVAGGLGPFADQFKVHSSRPALLLNTTFVETGQRVAFSPFPLRDLNDRSLQAFEDIALKANSLENVTLAEAAVTSARFPGLMPAYGAKSSKDLSWNFVDGGYADNSGAATAVAIVEAIREPAAAKKVDVRLIILTNEDREPEFDTLRGTSLTDTWAPIQAVLNVRSSLASREVSRAIERLHNPWSKGDENLRAKENWRVGIIRLDQTNFSLQLAWTISRTTNLIVSLFVAKPEYCDQPVTPRRLEPRAAPVSGVTPRPEDEQTPEPISRAPGADDGAQERSRQAKEDAALITRNACLVSDIVNLLTPGGSSVR